EFAEVSLDHRRKITPEISEIGTRISSAFKVIRFGRNAESRVLRAVVPEIRMSDPHVKKSIGVLSAGGCFRDFICGGKCPNKATSKCLVHSESKKISAFPSLMNFRGADMGRQLKLGNKCEWMKKVNCRSPT
ncbi:hypothetical protein PMAYCL1PPCAC_19591, partial [Pristionchus mayeri]